MNSLQTYFHDFLSLFFPEVCAACGTSLVKQEVEICLECEVDLPYTNFHLIPDNTVARQFWGRVPLKSCSALLFFTKGTKVQNLLHQFKYNNRPEIGVKLGEMYGRILLGTEGYVSPDVILPVPLHPKKMRKRGYNQSDYFAQGLANTLKVPVLKSGLQRAENTSSQTKKNRFSRYENMKDMFFVPEIDTLKGKHILLVDDIITTGATLEACSVPLLEVSGTTLSIAGIAFAN